MRLFTPRHPLLKAVFAVGSALWYLVQWRRGKKKPQQTGKVVDATGTVIDDTKRT